MSGGITAMHCCIMFSNWQSGKLQNTKGGIDPRKVFFPPVFGNGTTLLKHFVIVVCWTVWNLDEIFCVYGLHQKSETLLVHRFSKLQLLLNRLNPLSWVHIHPNYWNCSNEGRSILFLKKWGKYESQSISTPKYLTLQVLTSPRKPVFHILFYLSS